MNKTASLQKTSLRLIERIMDTIPIDNQAFMKVIGLLDIEASHSVASAGVTTGARSRLLINPDFVEQHCVTDEALVALVLHEMNHILMGHSRMLKTTTPLQNFVFDAVINALLCQARPDKASTGLFRSLYRPDVFPEALLRPPARWRDKREFWHLKGDALAVHKALYSEASATCAELHDLLVEPLDGKDKGDTGDVHGFDNKRLIGSHDDGEDRAACDPGTVAAIREAVESWPTEEATGYGRGHGQQQGKYRLDPIAAQRCLVAQIRLAVLSSVSDRSAGRGIPATSLSERTTYLPYQTLGDRRAGVRSAFGLPSLMFRSSVEEPGVTRNGLAHLYLDVSFSMNDVLPLIYGAILPLLGCLHQDIHLFSTTIHDVPHTRLRRGAVVTDGGTDIACVTGHMVTNGISHAVVVTDGMVGDAPREHREWLRSRGARLSAVLTDESQTGFGEALGIREFLATPAVTR